jgi:hypothetical protein
MQYQNKNANIANFFWGGEISSYELSNFLSFKNFGFSVNIWSYEVLDLPQGLNLKKAETILDEDKLNMFTQNFQKSNMSSFSNLFRYELLLKEGGWWFDSDCICLKHVDEFMKLSYNQKFVLGLENENLIGSSVMYINDQNITNLLLDETYKRIAKNEYKFYWGEIGPYLITDVFLKNDLFQYTFDRKLFFQIEPDNFHNLFLPSYKDSINTSLRESFVCHTWNEMFRKYNISKSKLPPKKSYIYEHINKYLEINTKSYSFLFSLRFKSVFKYFYKSISRLKTLF